MSSKTVFGLIALMFVLMCFLYIRISGLVWPAVLAAVVMLIVGFFFATVSGSLVGMIGSSNNPVSGLTLSTLIIAALLMVSLGVSGISGVAAVLGVAAVVCVSASVAGELLQDFKVGYILGGTPRTIQIAELIAVVVASLVMYLPLMLLHEANIKAGGIGFGDRQLSAPQAGLMATLAMGIVGGDMPWPLVVVGIFFGIAMIMMQVKSPMLVAVGMYLPFRDDICDFPRRRFPLARRLGGEAPRVQRSAEGAGGKCRRAHRFRTDRRRSRAGPALGRPAVRSRMDPNSDFSPSFLSRGNRRDGGTGGPDDLAAALERRRSKRTRAAYSHDVNTAGMQAWHVDAGDSHAFPVLQQFSSDPQCPSWFTVFHVHRRKYG